MPVIVYGSPGCYACKMTHMHLERRDIAFTRRYLSDFDNVLELIAEHDLKTAPIVHVIADDGAEDFWDGYRPDRIDALVI
jgi:glutaredoxin-like protein NrdH